MWLGCEQPLLLRDVLLEDVRLQGAVKRRQVGALPLGRDEIHAEDGYRWAADRHARRHASEVDATEQDIHIGGRVDRDTTVADLAERLWLVRVATHQRRHVEGDRQ